MSQAVLRGAKRVISSHSPSRRTSRSGACGVGRGMFPSGLARCRHDIDIDDDIDDDKDDDKDDDFDDPIDGSSE